MIVLRDRTEAEETMQAETARQCMTDIGLSRENADYVTALLNAGRRDEAWKKLRVIRCEMMDELHNYQRKVDQLDWLIRETEKGTK
jgi:peroxiredoxin family protein